MKYSYPQIVLEEIPDEISLALSISGCDIHCKECHSKFTWNPDYGKVLDTKELEYLIKKHKYISCVLFYGGEWLLDELKEFISIVHQNNLKAGLYTGRELDFFDDEFIYSLDYIKVGPYISKLGNLKSKNTNQKLYRIKDRIKDRIKMAI